MVLAWVAIFGVVFILVAFRGEFASLGQRLRAEATGSAIVAGRDGADSRCPTTGISGSTAKVNGQDVRFMVDSGASVTTVSRSAARTAGIPITFRRVIVNTANGTAWVTKSHADRLQVGPIERSDFSVDVNEKDDMNLLGMNFLSSLESWRVEGNLSGAAAMTNSFMLGGLYILMAIMLVLGALMSRRERPRRLLTMALAWVAIFAGGFVVFTFRDDLGYVAQRLRAEATGEPVSQGEEIRIPMAHRRPFLGRWRDQRRTVKFLIDSGATMTTIGRETAARVGVQVSPTRNQIVRTGQRLHSCGDRKRGDAWRSATSSAHNLSVHIADGEDLNVLGMNFLSSLQRWGVEGPLADPRPLTTRDILHNVYYHTFGFDDRDSRGEALLSLGTPRIDHEAAARSRQRLRMGQRAELRDDRALHDRGSL